MSAAAAGRQRRPWRAEAFGLTIAADFPLPGIEPAPGEASARSGSLRPTALRLATDAELDAEWSGARPRELFRQAFPDGTPSVTLGQDERRGHLLWSAGFGRYLVSRGGSRVLAAPPPAPPLHWQRLLVGHALPLAALMRGLELFHASAVVLRGRAVAVAGPSHGGKTSLAVQLVLRGGGLLTDDALALEPTGDRVLAHRGASLVNVRHPEWARLSRAARARLGTVAGHDGDAVRVLVRRHAKAAPLGALVLCEPAPGARALELRAVRPDAGALLACTHNFVIRSPERMAVQLATCAALASSAEVLRASVPPGVGAAELAAVIDERLA